MALMLLLVFELVASQVGGVSSSALKFEHGDGYELLLTNNLEEVSEVEIQFENPLPHWIKGTLVRNGVGRFSFGQRQMKHAFDGFAKLSSWKFYGNGTTTFSTKFLQSQSYQASVAKNDIAPYLMFEEVEPDFNEIQKVEALLHGMDNTNVNVYDFYNSLTNRSEFMAISDLWKIYQIHPENLTTVGPVVAPLTFSPGDRVLKFLSFLSSAHPLPESGTRDHLTFFSTFGLLPNSSSITLVRIKSAMRREKIATWHVDKVPYMHSFSVSQNYAILFASPCFINALKTVEYSGALAGLDWFQQENTTVYVVHLKTGVVKTLKTDNFFPMHHVNAYETETGQIVVDIASYESPKFIKSLHLETLKNVKLRNEIPSTAPLRRYVIDLKFGTVSRKHFSSTPGKTFVNKLDMPTINENYRFKKHCYVYGIVSKSDGVNYSNITLVKKDVCRANADLSWIVPYHYPMEAWFVPAPDALKEDDGVIMTNVLDGPNEKTYLVIIDAGTMTTVNRAYLPVVVPFSFHGRLFKDIL